MKAILALLCGIAPVMPFSMVQGQTFENCAELARNSDRVACFDVMREGTSAAPDGDWSVRQEPSEFTDDTNVYLSLQSRDASVCGINRDDKVVLWIRCREDTTSLLFQTSCHMTSSSRSDYGDVHVSFDDGAARVVPMTKWRDDHSLGLWRGGDAIPLLRDMLDAQTMTVRMKPFDEDLFTVTFDVAGLDAAIAPLRAACHW